MAWYRQSGQKGSYSFYTSIHPINHPSIHLPHPHPSTTHLSIHPLISPSPQALWEPPLPGTGGTMVIRSPLGLQGAQILPGVHRCHKATVIQCGQCWDRGALEHIGAHGPKGSARASLRGSWKLISVVRRRMGTRAWDRGTESAKLSRDMVPSPRHRETLRGKQQGWGQGPASPGAPFLQLPPRPSPSPPAMCMPRTCGIARQVGRLPLGHPDCLLHVLVLDAGRNWERQGDRH